MQACKLRLPPPKTHHHRPSSSLVVSSLLFEPSSRSLALMLSDSSILLYPSLSLPFSPPPPTPPPPPTVIPPISTSGCFLRLLSNPSSNLSALGRVVFLTASPHAAGSAVLLRAWILRSDLFSPAKLSFKKECGKLGVALDLRHGFSVRLAGSVNVFVLHSPASAKIWIFATRMNAGGDREDVVDLMKCAVIDCVVPIYSVKLSSGFLLLGEVGGVRVFLLRPLVKGGAGKRKDLGRKKASTKPELSSKGEFTRDGQKKKLPNGVVIGAVTGRSSSLASVDFISSTNRKFNGESIMTGAVWGVEMSSNGCAGTTVSEDHASSKVRAVKLRQNSGGHASFFVEIKSTEAQTPESKTGILTSLKAVAVHPVSPKKFLILDSVGNLHLLSMHNTILDTEVRTHTFLPSVNAQIKHLDCTMKVQLLAVHPDTSSSKLFLLAITLALVFSVLDTDWHDFVGTQIVWISDSSHCLHMALLADTEVSIDEKNADESKGKPIQMPVTEAIFTGEKIQDIVPFAANSLLILGQANMFAYAAA